MTADREVAAGAAGGASGAAAGTARSGLTWRIFTATAAIVVAVLVVTLLATYVLSERAATESLRRGLATTRSHLDGLLEGSRRQLAAKARIYMVNVAVRSQLESATDTAVFVDQAETINTEIGASWVQLIDRDGIRVARSDDPAAPPQDLSGSPLVQAAMLEGGGHGFGRLRDGELFDAVTVPYFGAGNQLIGVVMAAMTITDSIAEQISAETGSEIVFFTQEPAGAARIVAASPGVGDRDAAAAAIAQVIADSGDFAITLGDTRYAGMSQALATTSGERVGGVMALRDRDAALAPFRRLQWLVLAAGLLGLVIAFAVSLSTARKITRPVHALVAATRRAADGDYTSAIPQQGSDEIGALAGAFRRLLGDLREKQSLVEFLQGTSLRGGGALDADRTVSMAAVQHQVTGAGLLAPGAMLAGRYAITSVLGAGGMGTVYKAVDQELGEPVAIKTLKPEMMEQDPAALERFRSEIRLARRISHRNVVRTHDIGIDGGLYYITMEFVEGRSLKELIQSRGRLPAAAVLPIARQLCRALEVAHDAGVIHRDIKPQNMVVEGDGVLKVMDFGIARLAQRTEGHTQAGMVVGTPDYMAPEQLLGDPVDARADVYAMGVVLYECLTGQLPHSADSVITLIAKVLEEEPAPPAELVPDVPLALSEVVVAALTKSAADRVPSATAMLRRLDGM